jgi:hypothetical protein
VPTIQATVLSTLPPTEVLRVLTDFGPSRADAWPGIDSDHLQVHEQGENFAEVTEGNKIGWERERYSWDAEAGTVSATTVDSNLWGPGSRWDYTLTPKDGGTEVGVTLVRRGKGIKGKLIGALLPLIGKRMVAMSLGSALKTT